MAIYRASIDNHKGVHTITLQHPTRTQTIEIPPKTEGFGSSVSGGELLFLALATCYCNDIYREGARRGIHVERVEVEVEGDFEGEHKPNTGIRYNARVKADASEQEILDLMHFTDQIAEIQNTVRSGPTVTLVNCEALGTK